MIYLVKHQGLIPFSPWQGVVITYDGWYAPIYFVEEDKDPAKNLPRSMIGTALACIAIFLLVNVALFRVLRMDHLAGSPMPAVDAALLLFGGRGRALILLISAVAVISSINASLMYGPRILFSMSRDGLLPRNITSVNRGGTPLLDPSFCVIVSIALALSGSFDTLIAIASILWVAVYLSGFAALLTLRRNEPDLPGRTKHGGIHGAPCSLSWLPQVFFWGLCSATSNIACSQSLSSC